MEITIRGGVLKDGRGDRIGKIKKATVEVEDEWLDLAVERLAEAGRGGTTGGSSVAVPNSQQTTLVVVDEGSGEKKEKISAAEIDSVWDCYVKVMEPRSKDLGAGERKLIREAFKVASAEEIQKAIRGCASSDFHMGKNNRSRKYNSLSQIIKGRRGKETTRERLDYFIAFFEKSGGSSSAVPSASRDVVEQRKKDVQRGHRFRDDPVKVQKAMESEQWLKEHGVKTTRKPDGYPIFEWEGG